MKARTAKLRIEPLTPECWDDLVELFERPGASIARGCYCMFYRRTGGHDVPPGLTHSESNRRAPNHRYTSGPAIRAFMITQGWVTEGNGPDLIFACTPTLLSG